MVNRPTSGFLYLSLGDQEAAETKGPFQRVVKVLETIAPVDKSQPDESGTPQKDAPSTAATNATEAKDKIVIAEGFRWRADLSVGGNHNSNPVLSTPVGLCEMFSTNRANTCRTIKR